MSSHTNRFAWIVRSLVPLVIMLALVVAGRGNADAATPTTRTRPTAIPTARATIKPITARITATPAPVSDPVPALSSCANDIFGLQLSYTQTGGLTAQVARTLNLPTQVQAAVTAALNGNGTAVYGKTANGGLELLIYGSGSGTKSSTSVAVNSASLCYLQLPSNQPAPTSSEAALTLLKATFPGVPQRAPYGTTTMKGGYLFLLATAHPVPGSTATAAQSLALASVVSKQGLLLSGLSAIGTYSITGA